VRRIIAISLLLLTIATTETGMQLMKLPVLVSHFSDHLSDRRSNNLADFLSEHYSLGQHQDSDKQQDQQLPFKSISVESFYSLYMPVAPVVLVPYTPGVAQQRIALLPSFSLQDHFAGIFHPPKYADLA
jgi:hypothetical protein